MNIKPWLEAAEVFDSWRVVPRLLLFGYCIWVVHVTDQILHWYFLLPATARGIEASGMASVVITAVTGLSAWIFRIYSDNGRDWSAQAVTQQTTIAQTTTTAPTT